MSGKAVATANGESPPTVDKKQEKLSIVELRNGRVLFKQKPMSYEKQSETLQEIVSFRAMLEDRVSSQQPPLTTFPEEYKPLIAKLSHESDKTLTALAKHIQQELLPTLEGKLASVAAASLPLTTVESAVKSVLVRNNYGVEAPLGVRLPVALSVWRWEVGSDHMDWLPKNSRERAEARLAERVKARADLKAMLEALPQEERDVILEPKKVVNRLPAKDSNRQNPTPNLETQSEDVTFPESSKRQGRKNEDEEQGTSSAKDLVRSRKPRDLEKSTKEKERQEKKAARLEKDRKEKDRSQSLMTKFFSKPKAPVNGSDHQNNIIIGPSKIQSDFEHVFKPFVLGKDRILAPQNWFHDQRRRRRRAVKASNHGVIIVESEDECDVTTSESRPTEEELCAMSRQARLNDSLSSQKSCVSLPLPLCRRNPPGFKTYHPNSIRNLMTQLSEAEISGNDDLVRELLTKLCDRDVYPAKAYFFHNDARPGYFGTWTRSSKIIGPRRPFAQDTLVFDYSYDSGEEWEEEPLGEDVVEDGEEDDGEDDDCDSDLDSWLVDDDEELDFTGPSGGSSPPPTFNAPAPPVPKRKAEDSGQISGKKRKVVVPLVPFAKGPVWETRMGQSEYEPFNSYKIRLFNDTPCAIDPFTFVSTCLEDYKSHQRNIKIPTGLDSTVVASPHLIPASTSLDLSASSGGYSNAKKHPTAAKSSFPDAHITFLLDKIKQLQASSITALVEAVYQELREHKVKKIAIESKIREVGEKCKDKRVWVVKPALMQLQAS